MPFPLLQSEWYYRNTLLFFVGCCLLWTSSCTRSLYVPNEGYLMGISEKGEIKAAANIPGLRDSYRQLNFHAAYSPINHLGIVASLARIGNTQTTEETQWKQNLQEVALGFYNKKISSENPNQYVLFDIYAGMGWAKNNSKFGDFGEMDVSFRRQFLHTGIHVCLSQHFGISFGLGIARIQFIEANLYSLVPSPDIYRIFLVRDSNPLFSAEPSIQYTAGYRYFKFYTSLTGLGTTIRKGIGNGTDTSIGHPLFQFGVVLEVDEFFKRKNK